MGQRFCSILSVAAGKKRGFGRLLGAILDART
jgi:hypothetical protein